MSLSGCMSACAQKIIIYILPKASSPDVTIMADWVLKRNYLSIYRPIEKENSLNDYTSMYSTQYKLNSSLYMILQYSVSNKAVFISYFTAVITIDEIAVTKKDRTLENIMTLKKGSECQYYTRKTCPHSSDACQRCR